MAQIFEEDDSFAGLTVKRKLSRHHDTEREVYLASDTEGNEVALTVFDLRSKRYAPPHGDSGSRRQPDFIDEIRFLKTNTSLNGLPEFIDSGIASHRRHRYGWMTQKYFDGLTLEELLERGRKFDIPDTRCIIENISEVIEAIRCFTKGGGHYNISPSNIIFIRTEGITRAQLVGFSNMGETYNGMTTINDKELDSRFRAPETVKGIFNHRSDIYSFGMVILTALMGTGVTDALGPVEYNKALWSDADKKMLSAVRIILHKATELNPTARFSSIKKFRDLMAKYVSAKKTIDIKGSESDRTEAQDKATNKTDSHALDEVAGMSELKTLFRRDFISIVRNPQIAEAYGIKPSNCTLLYGPQGCGKSFIAERAAKESGLRYKVVSPAELGSIYVHGAQQKIAETFAEAEKKAPMILIFDEFDALVPKRNMEMNPNQANEVNEMLTQMNNCAERGIYVIATTNRPCDLDPAIMRRGRVDRSIYVPMPDLEARKELFRLELKGRPCEDDIDFERLGKVTENYTCSDISYIVAEVSRRCFEDTIAKALTTPLPISMQRLIEVTENTLPSVSEAQRKDFLDLKERMENRAGNDARKKVGFFTAS